MKGKNFVKIFTIALVLVCIYQLSFTLIANRYESSINKKFDGNSNLAQRYLDSVSNQTLVNLGFAKFTYQQVKEQSINLGLDLQGGMNVVMEVSVVDLIKALSNYSKDPNFNKAIDQAILEEANSQSDFVSIFLKNYYALVPDGKLAAIFATRENIGKIDFNSSNADVEQVIRTEAEGAIDRSFNILRSRIDRFGVTQPNIQRQQGTGRIIIELPGVSNPERVRKLLQGTAKLEFWETYEAAEVLERLFAANKAIKDKLNAEELLKNGKEKVKNEEDNNLNKDTTVAKAAIEPKSDTSLLNNSDLLAELKADSLKNDSTAMSAEEFAKENPLFAVLSPNISQDNRVQQGPVVGFAMARDTAQINRYLAMDEARAALPRNLRLLWTVKGSGETTKFFQLVAIKTRNNDDRAPLEGDAISDARPNLDQNGAVEVSMNMNAEGAKIWKRLTADNIGKSIAIVLDNAVYSFPTVKGEISGGMSSISGGFTQNEAADLANILKAGKLPAPARILEEAVVGPSLGKEAINSGFFSLISGLLLVLIFMIIYYGTSGWVANLALFANVFFIFGVLASLQAVLTLPGIAGIVLTIGMSVDANVLIYERIREELRSGKGLKLAIRDGYLNAYSSIIDANVTTLLTGIILFTFGTGPIQGFATTLIIGILTSLFAAIFLTRLTFDWMLNKNKPLAFESKLSEKAFQNKTYDFMGKRKLMYAISGAIIVTGIISMVARGFSLGVDFSGGRSYIVELPTDAKTSELRTDFGKVSAFKDGVPEIKTFGTNNKFKITTKYLIEDKTEEADEKVAMAIYEGLKSKLTNEMSFEDFEDKIIQSSQKVGPTIVDDIKSSAFWSIIVSLLAIATYIYIRFRKLNYSLGAALSLIHDVLIILSIFSIGYGFLPFNMEIDQAFIAALLTIVGYSINDTVVVFDRLRENLGASKQKDDTEDVVNNAVNGTLSRTLITAVTTIFVVLILFIFGGEVIRAFSFALLIGLVVGTYSSIYIASAIVLDFQQKKLKQ